MKVGMLFLEVELLFVQFSTTDELVIYIGWEASIAKCTSLSRSLSAQPSSRKALINCIRWAQMHQSSLIDLRISSDVYIVVWCPGGQVD